MTLHEDQTRLVAQDWKESAYYARAEEQDWLAQFWDLKSEFRRLFGRLNMHTLVELACGHGRHTAHIINNPELCRGIERIDLLDINEENIMFCKERFNSNHLIHFLINNGWDFQPLESSSATAIFCYDAMVHFEYDAVQSYIEDAYRILTPGGRALLHHSNYDKSPGTHYLSNPLGRNFMSKNLFAHIAIRCGFEICEQVVLRWGKCRRLDCVSLIEKRQELYQRRSIVSSRSKLSGGILHKVTARKLAKLFANRE
jgi:SAM-dependent methyltransferase